MSDPDPDDDFLDGCAHVIESTDYDDEEAQSLRPLFPGDLPAPVEETAEQWRALFGGDS